MIGVEVTIERCDLIQYVTYLQPVTHYKHANEDVQLNSRDISSKSGSRILFQLINDAADGTITT